MVVVWRVERGRDAPGSVRLEVCCGKKRRFPSLFWLVSGDFEPNWSWLGLEWKIELTGMVRARVRVS